MGCEKQTGKYFVEISCLRDSEDEQCPNLTKVIWEVEMNEVEPEDGGQQKIHLVYVDLHASDALRIAKGLVRFCETLTH